MAWMAPFGGTQRRFALSREVSDSLGKGGQLYSQFGHIADCADLHPLIARLRRDAGTGKRGEAGHLWQAQHFLFRRSQNGAGDGVFLLSLDSRNFR
jgi:hypothetical protein